MLSLYEHSIEALFSCHKKERKWYHGKTNKEHNNKTAHMSKSEIDARIKYEVKIRDEVDKIRTPSFLSSIR